jgi:hypothetical protein
MLDYIWAGLPIVCTSGDVFASLVAQEGLGAVVAPDDAAALAAAIERLIDSEEERAQCRRRLLAVADEFRWRHVVAPLARFCEHPTLAPDRASAQRAHHVQLVHAARSYRLTRWAKRAALAAGVSPDRIQQWKAARPVRTAVGWIDRLSTAWQGR